MIESMYNFCWLIFCFNIQIFKKNRICCLFCIEFYHTDKFFNSIKIHGCIGKKCVSIICISYKIKFARVWRVYAFCGWETKTVIFFIYTNAKKKKYFFSLRRRPLHVSVLILFNLVFTLLACFQLYIRLFSCLYLVVAQRKEGTIVWKYGKR